MLIPAPWTALPPGRSPKDNCCPRRKNGKDTRLSQLNDVSTRYAVRDGPCCNSAVAAAPKPIETPLEADTLSPRPDGVLRRLNLIGNVLREVPTDLEGDLLVWRDPENEATRTYALAGAQVFIGRHHDNDIVIPIKSVSRRHAVIRPMNGGYLLRDLESSNGVRINGRRINSHLLGDGIVIELGNFPMIFCQSLISHGFPSRMPTQDRHFGPDPHAP